MWGHIGEQKFLKAVEVIKSSSSFYDVCFQEPLEVLIVKLEKW